MGRLSIWWDQAADGPTNMAADEVLAAEARRRLQPLVRLYRWDSPTVSLGAFQPIAEARSLGIVPGPGMVRRPSGGGAIVHGTDITYAVAVPAGHAWSRSPEVLYRAVHRPLVAELVSRGVDARLHEDDTPPSRGNAAAFFCFSRRSPGDVVVATGSAGDPPVDAKVLGGAQRRLSGVVIQHGSLLLHANVGVPPAWRHPGIGDVGLAIADDGVALASAWMNRFAAALPGDPAWEAGPFLADRGRRTEADAAVVRYRETRWCERR